MMVHAAQGTFMPQSVVVNSLRNNEFTALCRSRWRVARPGMGTAVPKTNADRDCTLSSMA
jgi:hypothetical protein